MVSRSPCPAWNVPGQRTSVATGNAPSTQELTEFNISSIVEMLNEETIA
jgi:hypothetical protein